MPSKNRVDLTLLKRLIAELENSLDTARGISTDIDTDMNEYVIEMSKATGLCTGLMQEASCLILDISEQVRASQTQSSKGSDLLDKILAPLKNKDDDGNGTN